MCEKQLRKLIEGHKVVLLKEKKKRDRIIKMRDHDNILSIKEVCALTLIRRCNICAQHFKYRSAQIFKADTQVNLAHTLFIALLQDVRTSSNPDPCSLFQVIEKAEDWTILKVKS